MPLYEYQCRDCGKTSESLIRRPEDIPSCQACGSTRVDKLMSAHASASNRGQTHPGPNDTACCGSAPGQASGCAGPGSCCGKTSM